MTITITYETQLKRAIGTASESIDVPDAANAVDVVRAAAGRHDAEVANMLLDTDGNVRSSVLMFVGDQQITRDTRHQLTDGDTIILMSPISGG